MNQPAARLVFALVLTLALAATTSSAVCLGDDARPRVARVYTASDILGMREHGFTVPADGEYSVRIWAPAGQPWTLDAAGTTWTLASKIEGDNAKTIWQSV